MTLRDESRNLDALVLQVPTARCRFCSFCAVITSCENAVRQSLPFHDDLAALQISSLSCALCKAFHNILSSPWGWPPLGYSADDLQARAQLSLVLGEASFIPSKASWTLLYFRKFVPGIPVGSGAMFSVSTSEISSPISTRMIWGYPTTDPLHRVKSIKFWMDECQWSHKACSPDLDILPARLLHVGTENREHVHLVLTEGLMAKETKFATLSHSWGSHRPLRLLQENQAAFLREVPASEIPKCFMDAIIITRGVGLHYIWIDSLCIIQDDPDDWRQEAAKMKSVYSASMLTIAASEATSSTMGCFLDWDPAAGEDASPDYEGTRPHDGLVLVPEELGLLVHVFPTDTRRLSQEVHLSTRGWALQEHVLSHRIIHCMLGEFQWHCRCTMQTERGIFFPTDDSILGSMPFLVFSTKEEANRIWWRWIQDYTYRQFTFEKDRLPALLGMIQEYQTQTQDTPLLGLWESTVSQDLRWIRVRDHSSDHLRTKSFKKSYNLPSWSWLSCAHAVSNDVLVSGVKEHMTSIRDHTKIESWQLAWTGVEFMSPVLEAFLVIESPMQEMSFRLAPTGAQFNPPYLLVNDEEAPNFEDRIPWTCAGQFDEPSWMTDHEFTTCTCLLLRTWSVGTGDISKDNQEHGEFLMLQRQDEDLYALPTFRRIGIGRVDSQQWVDQILIHGEIRKICLT